MRQVCLIAVHQQGRTIGPRPTVKLSEAGLSHFIHRLIVGKNSLVGHRTRTRKLQTEVMFYFFSQFSAANRPFW
jgi:hypothetical protein